MADPSVPAGSLEQRIERIAARAVSGAHPEGQIEYEIAELIADALAAQRQALAKLREYARHDPDCQVNFDPAQVGVRTGNVYPCTCGLNAALSASPEGER